MGIVQIISFVVLPIVRLEHHALVVNNGFERAIAQPGAFFVLTLPATVWWATWEYRVQVTPGKRLVGLKVVSYNEKQLTLRHAFLRSVIKVTLPWEVAHAAAWRLVTIHGTGPDIVSYVFLSCSYLIILINVVLLFLPTSRLLHDRIARTIVN